MKRVALALLIIAPIQATDFSSRFGPNSPVYNQPLYFSAQHMITRPEKKANPKKRYYTRRMQKADRRKIGPSAD